MSEETIITPESTSAPIEQAAPEAAPANSEVNFREMLPEQYRSMYPEFKKPEDFVKGYDELVRKLGGSISIPKDDAPQEELDKFYGKLGRPQTPDEYKFELNDNTKVDNEFLSKFKKTAHENGFTQKQAEQLFKWYNSEFEQAELSYVKQQEELQEKAKAELKVRWGNEYDRKLEEVQKFAQSLAGEPYFDKITKYGNDPDFIHVLSEVKSRYAKEDRLVHSGAMEGGSASKDYLGEARKLMSDSDYKFNTTKQQQVRELFQKITGQKK